MVAMDDATNVNSSAPIEVLGERSFPAVVSSLRGVRAFIRALSEAVFDDDTRLGDITLATGELATNAIEHGTGGELFVSAASSQQQFIVEVTSYGNHLDWNGERQPNDQVSGRGLLIVSTLADSMEIENSPGTVLVRCTFGREPRTTATL